MPRAACVASCRCSRHTKNICCAIWTCMPDLWLLCRSPMHPREHIMRSSSEENNVCDWSIGIHNSGDLMKKQRSIGYMTTDEVNLDSALKVAGQNGTRLEVLWPR